MALLRNHNGYMQATGLKIVRGVEKSVHAHVPFWMIRTVSSESQQSRLETP